MQEMRRTRRNRIQGLIIIPGRRAGPEKARKAPQTDDSDWYNRRFFHAIIRKVIVFRMNYWIVLLVSLLACSVGFHMYIWFFSVGYGLAIAAIAAVLAVGFYGTMGLPEWICVALLVVYGLRLSGYLLIREMKSAAKKKNSRRFVDTGLYRLVRCPNYLGELLIWLGMLVTGFTALRGFWQWALALLGFVLIAWVMFSGTRRLKLRQDKNYGSDPEFLEYVRTATIIIPFVPLYSVKKYKFLAA